MSFQIISFFKDIYKIWFPWLDIAILTLIYFFLWGEHINPYRQYQLIKYGDIATGIITGESGLFANSDQPRMRNFDYNFTLPGGEILKSRSHSFQIEEVDNDDHNFPVSAEILYINGNPSLNWIKSDIPSNLTELFRKNLMGGLVFILIVYLLVTILIRFSILDYRNGKSIREDH